MKTEAENGSEATMTTEAENGNDTATATEAENEENEEREFAFDSWLAEGISGVRAEGRRKKDEIVPEVFRQHIEESRTHMKAAKKEFLMALRSLVDAALKKVEAEPEPPKKATKIKVE